MICLFNCKNHVISGSLSVYSRSMTHLSAHCLGSQLSSVKVGVRGNTRSEAANGQVRSERLRYQKVQLNVHILFFSLDDVACLVTSHQQIMHVRVT